MVLMLAGCTAPPPAVEPGPQVAAPAALRGTLLAMRPVPADALEPAQRLLAGQGDAAGQPDPDLVELVVRTVSGTTIAVVQPATDGLRPGEPVSIRAGARPRIDPPSLR